MMYKVGIEEIKRLHRVPENTADHVVIIDNVRQFKAIGQGVDVEMDVVMAFFCQKGRAQLTIDGRDVAVGEGQILVLFPSSTITRAVPSDDLEGFMTVASPARLESYILFSKNIWNYISFLRDNPVITSEGDDDELIRKYIEITRKALTCSSSRYREDLAVSLMQSFIFQLIDIVTLPQHHIASENSMLRRQDTLFLNFLAVVNDSHGRLRFVREAADRLNVTPKYLSMLVVKVSKKPALQWIHDATYAEIERQMKFTNRSIREIAADLNFSNLSFFARFFKAHYGMSPTEYRRQESR